MNSNFNGILMGGFPSSGSTLLSVILDSHPDIVCGPESTLFCHPKLWSIDGFNISKDSVDEILFDTISDDGVINFSVPNEPFLEYYGFNKDKVLSSIKTSKNYYDFFQNFANNSLVKNDAKIFIEKTPQNIYSIDSFLKNNPHTKAIISIRDPRSILNSLINRGVKYQTACAVIALESNIIHSLMQDSTNRNRILLVKYENLVFNTENVCRDICDYLNVDDKYVQDMIQRSKSSRKNDVAQLRNTLLKIWTNNPLNEITDSAIHKWKDELKAHPFILLLNKSVTKKYLAYYVRKPKVLNVKEFMDLFGYSINDLSSHKHTEDTMYDLFYSLRVSDIRPVLSLKNRARLIVKRILPKWLLSKIKKLLSKIKKLPSKIKKLLSKVFHKLLAIYLKIKPNYSKSYKWRPPKNIDNNIDVVVSIAFLGRHKVLHAVIEEILNSSNQPLNVYIVLACSNDNDFEFSRRMQEAYKKVGIVVCDNKPVGNKWHIAVEGAKKLNPKALLITGSDDLVSSDYLYNNFKILIEDDLKTIGMVGPRSWYMYNLSHDDLYKVSYNNSRHKMPLGAGRLYSRVYLDNIKWKLFERSFDKLLDDKGYYEVIENNLIVYNPTFDDGCILSVKGDWSALNSFDKILKADSIIHSKVRNSEKEILLHKFKNSFEILKDCK